MSPYNISVVGPEDDDSYPYPNALHLQPGLGHQPGQLSGNDQRMQFGDGKSYEHTFDPSSNNISNSQPGRPQLTQLSTDYSISASDMQQPYDGMGNSFNPLSFHFSPEELIALPTAWRQVDEMYPNSPSSASFNGSMSAASPSFHGLSPLSPNTLLSVEHSPSTPSFPSPGSQGSSGSYYPSPSPNILSHPLTPLSTHGSSLTVDIAPPAEASLLRSSPVLPQSGLIYDAQHQAQSQYNYEVNAAHSRARSHSAPSQMLHPGPGFDDMGVDVKPFASNAPPRGYQTHHTSYSIDYSSSLNVPAAYPSYASLPLEPTAPSEVSTGLPAGPLFVPQRLYKPHTSSDRRRYVEEVVLEQPIVFQLQNPSEAGMPLGDALTSRFMRLIGRDDPMFINRGPSISIRLVWEGYQPWSRQIPTRDFKSPPGPITKAKLAKNVAKSIVRFIDEHKGRQIEQGADPRWQVGPGRIEANDLRLVSLHHVSMGSWQANLCLNRPLIPAKP